MSARVAPKIIERLEGRTVVDASRVAARAFNAYLSPKTDLLARLQMLEGAAGVPRGAWTGGRLSPGSAKDHFGAEMDETWTARSNSGLAEKAVTAVRRSVGEIAGDKGVQSSMRDMSAEEMVNSFIAGLWPWASPGEEHSIMSSPPFYAIGEKMRTHPDTMEGLVNGSLKPQRFEPIVYSWISQKARSEYKKWSRSTARGKAVPEWLPSGTSRFDTMQTENADESDILTRILGQKNNPKAKRMRTLLRRIGDKNPRQADAEVFQSFLRVIESLSGGETRTEFGRMNEYGVPRGIATTIGEELGKSRQFVGQALKRSLQFVVERASKEPALRKLWLEMKDEAIGGAFGKLGSDELLADLETWANGYLSGIEDEFEREGDREVTVGPLTLSIGKFPGANSGAYSHKARSAEGDCYEAAANYLVENGLGMWGGSQKKGNLILVHAEVMGQGPLDGVAFGHAWVEDGNTVIDRSNGGDVRMSKQRYYAAGKIGEINNIHKYTVEEARRKLLDTGVYGPWDLRTSTGL